MSKRILIVEDEEKYCRFRAGLSGVERISGRSGK